MVQRDRRRPPARLLARMNLYVPLEHVVQQGRGIFGRRDAPDDRAEHLFRKSGRTGYHLLCSTRTRTSKSERNNQVATSIEGEQTRAMRDGFLL
jgi:hypothetical protein